MRRDENSEETINALTKYNNAAHIYNKNNECTSIAIVNNQGKKKRRRQPHNILVIVFL